MQLKLNLVVVVINDNGCVAAESSVHVAAHAAPGADLRAPRAGGVWAGPGLPPAFGMIKWKQEGAGFDNFGLDLVNPDFVKLAEAYACHGHRCSRASDLAAMLQTALATPGVHLIEVPVDYSENHKVLTLELQTLAAQSAPH